MTVKPEIRIERPDVAAAASSAADSLRTAGPFLAFTFEIEEGVVDADGETDEQDHLFDLRVDRHEMTR